MVLGAAYYVVDIRGFSYGTMPGIIFGANAIAVYVLADILALVFYHLQVGDNSLNAHFVHGLVAVGLSPKLASAGYAMLFVCVNFLPALFLYRKKIFIKL